MHDRQAHAGPRLEHACALPHGALHVVDVLERHERHDEVERAVLERQRGRVRATHANPGSAPRAAFTMA